MIPQACSDRHHRVDLGASGHGGLTALVQGSSNVVEGATHRAQFDDRLPECQELLLWQGRGPP